MSGQRVVWGLLVVVVSLGLLPSVMVAAAPSVPSAPPPPGARHFPETGHWLAGAFLRVWDRQGGLRRFGFPLTPPLQDGDGKTVQWTERARLEYDPHLPAGQRVVLGLLGQEVSQAHAAEPGFQPVVASPRRAGRFFVQTGHTLTGRFLSGWEAGGGLPVFGYPISEVLQEASPTDGVVRAVQYFERTRFEHHPDRAGTVDEVQFGLLGRQLYRGGGTLAPAVVDDVAPALVRRPPAELALQPADLPAGFTLREAREDGAGTMASRLYWHDAAETIGIYAVSSVVQVHPSIEDARLGFADLAASLAEEHGSSLDELIGIGEEGLVWSQTDTRADGLAIRFVIVGFRQANVVGVVMTTAPIAASDTVAAERWALVVVGRAGAEVGPADGLSP